MGWLLRIKSWRGEIFGSLIKTIRKRIEKIRNDWIRKIIKKIKVTIIIIIIITNWKWIGWIKKGLKKLSI